MGKYNFEKMSQDDISEFIDSASPREGQLLAIYDHEPELFIQEGENLLSETPCKQCGEYTIYIGPNVNIFEQGRCGECGTLNDIS